MWPDQVSNPGPLTYESGLTTRDAETQFEAQFANSVNS